MPKAPPVHCPAPIKRKRRRDASGRDPVVAKIHQSGRWKALSPRFLRTHPLCADPHGWHARDGRHEPATQVHHIVPIREQPGRAFDLTNLMAVCAKCHARLDAGLKRGKSQSESQNETTEGDLA